MPATLPACPRPIAVSLLDTSPSRHQSVEDQKAQENLGGTMRLGLYPCKVLAGTRLHKVYQAEIIYERHRHRYEFNNAYRKQLVSRVG